MNAPTGLPGPTDAELVAGVLAADREAFAVVYDRYGTKLYDFAYSMLRQREDAADAVADSFVIVAERLQQLREPDRLRPWLYAVVRSECLRRLKARKRIAFGDDEQLVRMADDALTPDQIAEQSALRQIVWDAAAGLADRDRALLDLHLRQGLEGAELGEAMGVSAANAYVMLNRLRAQVDRSLGALLIARLGREDCDELDAVLGDWDGNYSPLVRKRVARHIDDCDVCGTRRKKMVSPWMLLASVPLFVAPLSLRDRVIADTRLVAYSVPLSAVPPVAPRRRPKAAVASVTAAVVIALAGVAALMWPGDEDASPKADVVASTTPSTTPQPTATPTAPSPAKPVVKPGSITVSTMSIDLGRRGSATSVTLTNSGGRAVVYRATSGSDWLSASPGSASIDPGTSVRVGIQANRRKVEEGRSSGRIAISWATGHATVKVSLDEENDPVVGRPTTGTSPSCNVPVSVSVADQSGLSSVVLRWTGPDGAHATAMTRSGSAWNATMGEFSVGGSVTMQVTATDKHGNSATGASRTITVNPCPQ